MNSIELHAITVLANDADMSVWHLLQVKKEIAVINDRLDADFKTNGTYTQLPASLEFRYRVAKTLKEIREAVDLVQVEIDRLEE